MRHLPSPVWGKVPVKELALLRIPLVRFYGEKITFALLGVCLPGVLSAFFGLLGLRLPLMIPTAGTVVLTVVLWFMPNLNAATEAKQARLEFNRALAPTSTWWRWNATPAPVPGRRWRIAAGIGDSWVFGRLGEELARSRWSGQAPWDALHHLADDLGLPDLDDLADIMRLSGEEGAQVYATLRARSTAMRTAMLTAEQGKANEISERMVLPGSLLGVVFIALLIVPALLRLLTH